MSRARRIRAAACRLLLGLQLITVEICCPEIQYIPGCGRLRRTMLYY